ncbi:PIN domain-containing protein [Horticoccus luteus]|uniref:PIN domain-containing protein n=1 Tax=Horticoccus luteus TaxID=2862869 RepID=A0A8F9TX31_9BACT|nr:PIN domain-containing protein [Horticoccus luteus]
MDTSSWIDALRRDGDVAVRVRVQALMQTGEAGWCDFVRLELWNGLRGAAERKQMEALEADITLLATTDAVWSRSRELARRARASGLTVPGADVLIAACAWEHGVEIEHDDAHLAALVALFN